MNTYERRAEFWRRVAILARDRGDRVAMIFAIRNLRAIIEEASAAL
jgi:hypothetical protein